MYSAKQKGKNMIKHKIIQVVILDLIQAQQKDSAC